MRVRVIFSFVPPYLLKALKMAVYLKSLSSTALSKASMYLAFPPERANQSQRAGHRLSVSATSSWLR
jgi:hypothetical protein